MRIDGMGPVIERTPRRGARQRHESEAEARSLVAIEPAAPGERAIPLSRHPAAPFLAHLIATRIQAPQTRARRRAEPGEALAAYGASVQPAPRRRFGKCA